MKAYVHNPAVFRSHFTGKGLPAFRGARYQRGHGLRNVAKSIGRVAVPLLKAGVRASAPHIQGVVQKAATSAMRQAFPNSPGIQRFVGNVAGRAVGGLAGKVSKTVSHKRRKKRPAARRTPVKRRATTTRRKNIFTA